MKARAGFVSNSSSSSFVVATEPRQDEFVATFKISLAPVIDKVCKTLSDLQEGIRMAWGYGGQTFEDVMEEYGDYMTEIYEKSKKAIRDGKVVVIGRVSNEGDGEVSSFLFANGFKDVLGVEVIQDPEY